MLPNSFIVVPSSSKNEECLVGLCYFAPSLTPLHNSQYLQPTINRAQSTKEMNGREYLNHREPVIYLYYYKDKLHHQQNLVDLLKNL